MFVFILKYLVVALCLAYLNHVFSKKKAVRKCSVNAVLPA